MKRFLFSILALAIFVSNVWCEEKKTEAPQQGAQEYVIGVDDIIDISVLQPDKFTTTLNVSPDGSISFPYIGNVNVKGLSLGQVQDLIQERLSNGYMKYPVVSASLKESRSRKFSVYGLVARPGSYPVEENLTILRGISLAGGLTEYGSSGQIKVVRPKADGTGSETIETSIQNIMGGAARDANIVIKAGDTIIIYQEKYFVYGEVNRPGPYPLEAKTSVLKAISTAGGFTKFGSSSRVKILRPKENGNGSDIVKVNINAAMNGDSNDDILLKPGDTVVVSEGVF